MGVPERSRCNVPGLSQWFQMSTVAEIENAIAKLPAKEFVELGRWFDDQRNQRWDEQMSRDAESGKLDFLSAELDGFLAKGEVRPLHEILRHS